MNDDVMSPHPYIHVKEVSAFEMQQLDNLDIFVWCRFRFIMTV